MVVDALVGLLKGVMFLVFGGVSAIVLGIVLGIAAGIARVIYDGIQGAGKD